MDTNQVVELLKSKQMSWRHVDGLPCVHTFYKDFYINLCLYDMDDKNVISINVDDVDKNENELVDQNFVEGIDSQYTLLRSIYDWALKNCETIPSGSLA